MNYAKSTQKRTPIFLTNCQSQDTTLVNLGTDFEFTNLAFMLAVIYSNKKINGSVDNNKILRETILLCYTGGGNYIKIIIDKYCHEILFR